MASALTLLVARACVGAPSEDAPPHGVQPLFAVAPHSQPDDASSRAGRSAGGLPGLGDSLGEVRPPRLAAVPSPSLPPPSPPPVPPPPVPPPPTPPPPAAYGRMLSEFNTDGREMQLFDLMEGAERGRHLLKYEAKKSNESTLGLCEFPSSNRYGEYVNYKECFDPAQQDRGRTAEGVPMGQVEPWITPSIDNAVLLANDPGIWSVRNFLSLAEADKMLALVRKYGKELGFYGPCKHEHNHRATTHAHPSEGKACFKISSTNVCEGPYDLSACEAETHAADGAFIESIISRFGSMWPFDVAPGPYAKFQLSLGDTPPVDLHVDAEKTISFVLYLTDGGAAMLFPYANVTVTPEKGTAHTWLNSYKDGTRNPMADHAVQAHPLSAGERLVMLFEVCTPPQDILAAASWSTCSSVGLGR